MALDSLAEECPWSLGRYGSVKVNWSTVSPLRFLTKSSRSDNGFWVQVVEFRGHRPSRGVIGVSTSWTVSDYTLRKRRIGSLRTQLWRLTKDVCLRPEVFGILLTAWKRQGPNVTAWGRFLQSQPRASFWFPQSTTDIYMIRNRSNFRRRGYQWLYPYPLYIPETWRISGIFRSSLIRRFNVLRWRPLIDALCYRSHLINLHFLCFGVSAQTSNLAIHTPS